MLSWLLAYQPIVIEHPLPCAALVQPLFKFCGSKYKNMASSSHNTATSDFPDFLNFEIDFFAEKEECSARFVKVTNNELLQIMECEENMTIK